MKILAIDTSSKSCGVCILEDQKEIYKEDLITDRSHSVKLMPIIKDVFEKAKLTIKNIDFIVCDKGPGSFTGIRIGVATAKAFADSLNIPLIGVNSLEALSYNCLQSGFICPILDAKNDNCYTALYKLENEEISEIIAPFSESLDNAIQNIQAHAKTNITFVGDGIETFKEKLEESFSTPLFSENNLLDSYKLGLAGYFRFINNQFESELPLYLKKPQAQRQLEERLKRNECIYGNS